MRWLKSNSCRVLLSVIWVAAIVALHDGCANNGEGNNHNGPILPDRVLQGENINICSFNVQWVGYSEDRDNAALAEIVSWYDIVVIQEVVSPPYPAYYPNGAPVNPDNESKAFFDAMKAEGFEYKLSVEDTGPGETNHTNSSATEWFVAFYKPDKVEIREYFPTRYFINPDRLLLSGYLPTVFIAADRTDHPDYERVPQAFGFRTIGGNLDFVLISVHLKPGADAQSAARRKHELASINAWISTEDGTEKDFIILGDMNIEDTDELTDATPEGFLSLNDECVFTNTNVNNPKPYDHVMYLPAFTPEIDTDFDFVVIDLLAAMEPYWDYDLGDYPGGENYDHNLFRKYYSDHHPVTFRMTVPGVDDD